MNRLPTAILTALLAVAVAACSSAPERTITALEQRVRDYVDAFNLRDLDAMLALADESIIWWMLIDGEFVAETRGKDALRQALSEYMTGDNSIRSRLLDVQVQGQTVSVIEQALWEVADTTHSQCAVAVYTLDQGRIAQVWYYPASDCP